MSSSKLIVILLFTYFGQVKMTLLVQFYRLWAGHWYFTVKNNANIPFDKKIKKRCVGSGTVIFKDLVSRNQELAGVPSSYIDFKGSDFSFFL